MKLKICDTQTKLAEKVMSLKSQGSSPMGPAVLTSIILAGEGAPGSTVIICTDGAANEGIGKIDKVSADELEKSRAFYNKLGDMAKEKGVTCNIISIKGEECSLRILEDVCFKSGGDIIEEDPQNLK